MNLYKLETSLDARDGKNKRIHFATRAQIASSYNISVY